ncbi:MAG: 3-dehydroquinate synthase [Gemmatimonadota bacterium]
MPPITITHALGSYPVYVEAGMLLTLGDLVGRHLPDRRLALISDANVDRLYDEWAREAKTRLVFDARLRFAAGEAHKTRETWSQLSDELLTRRFGRDSAIIALGGGVVGDVAGFVAATYLRGIPFVQVPTTLLAMLDASVGGKVGVDTPEGKNLIGAFHPPALVVADPLTLRRLPEREYRAGLAEAVKHGLIEDPEYFAWIESEARGLLGRDLDIMTRLIRRSVEIKAAVVSADEREGGRRATLNAGHTVAHALEQASGYRIPHGEAVGLGLIAECRIAEQAGIAPAGLSARVSALLSRLELPVRQQSGASMEDLLLAMTQDKKNRSGLIRLSLPVALGQMHEGDGSWTIPIDRDLLETGLAAIA